MPLEGLPYLLLLLAIICAALGSVRVSLTALGAAMVAGLLLARMSPAGIFAVTATGILFWLPTRFDFGAALRYLAYAVALLLSFAMSSHLVPGFSNLPVYQTVTFAADSVPFTMYLNFDKTVVGLFIYLFFLKPNALPWAWRRNVPVTGAVLVCLVLAIMPLALAIGYVRFDPKFPELGWVWMLNNLFFVCLAEEGLFRGFIQGGLAHWLPKKRGWPYVAIAIAAVLFGLAHYKGGIAYVLLAGFAGLFYGYAYHKTSRIECSMLVHFGLNLIHFLFFSYPALVR